MNKNIAIPVLMLISGTIAGQSPSLNERISKIAADEVSQFKSLYIDLHQHPELSHFEFNTSKKMADELKALGFEVTPKVGGNGVVGVYKNGNGKVIMLRTDMDALPVKENTGLPFASQVIMKDITGNECPVMHACGHDLHMSVWLATLKTLVSLKKEWRGTIVAIGQPEEEVSGGSESMINDGLFKRFPKPDVALCYHVNAELPTGTVGYYPGPIFAGMNSVNITVYGRGGHGAMPHMSIDPVVLSARIILDIQTIVSRSINPVKPAVVTVGAIHGGTKHNVIPDEVKLMLTVRFFEDDVYKQIQQSLERITHGDAISAGLPDDKMPLIEYTKDFTPPTANDPKLVTTVADYMKSILGENNVIKVDPATVSEDFGKYGRTEEKIPIALFWLGGVNREKYDDHVKNGTYLPPLHNSTFAPDFEPAFKTGVTAMTKAMIELFGSKDSGK
jgi:amidohydrolase